MTEGDFLTVTVLQTQKSICETVGFCQLYAPCMSLPSRLCVMFDLDIMPKMMQKNSFINMLIYKWKIYRLWSSRSGLRIIMWQPKKRFKYFWHWFSCEKWMRTQGSVPWGELIALLVSRGVSLQSPTAWKTSSYGKKLDIKNSWAGTSASLIKQIVFEPLLCSLYWNCSMYVAWWEADSVSLRRVSQQKRPLYKSNFSSLF